MTAGIHESPPAPAPASPAFAVAGTRLVWLYLISRRIPAAAGLLAALGCLLWAALHWHLNVAGGPAAQLVIPLVIETGAAGIVAVSSHGPFGEAERATGRWLPWLRLGAALALTAVAFAGPLLAAIPRLRIPLIIGELLAGLALGKSGFGVVDAANSTFQLFANIGFALVMFVVGTHVPIRSREVRSALPMAVARAGLAGAVAAAFGVGLASLFGTGHAALYAVLMASSSAALALPVIDSLHLQGPPVLSVTAQIAIADASCIVLLPLVIDFKQAPKTALGALGIGGCAVVLFIILRAADRKGWRHRMHVYSHTHEFALELRTNLFILFALAALAVT